MKSFILLLLIPFIFTSSIKIYCQPVITYDVMNFDIGESMLYYGEDKSDFSPGAAGADVFWDFSWLEGDYNQEIMFGGNNHCGEISSYYALNADCSGWWGEGGSHTSEREGFIDSSSYSFCEIGGFEFSMTFDDLYTPLIFPLTYGIEHSSEFSDTCDYGMAGEGDIPFSGETTLVADAYGTLKLFSGIYEDVLRVKVIDNIGCDYNVVDTYWWFKEGIRGPLFKYSKNYGWYDIKTIFVHSTAVGFVGINDETTASINIYPNPVSNQLKIEVENMQLIEVYNLAGSLMNSKQISGNEIILPVQSLDKGLYIIKIITADRILSSTFEKI